MELGEYLRILRVNRALVAGCVAVCVAVAAALAWLGPQRYAADTQLFVSARGGPGSITLDSQLAVQQRAHDFADVISGQGGAQAAVAHPEASGDAGQIDAAAPAGSAAINVTVTASSPDTALSMARALDRRMPPRLERLEGTSAPTVPPLGVSVTEPARASAAAATPRKPVYLGFGAVIGLAIGIAAAMLRNSLDRRVTADADATVAARSPVLAGIPKRRRSVGTPVMVSQPLSAAAERFRQLRDSLRAVRDDTEPWSLLVSSAVAREGRTEIVANLGLALAEAGERVVVVDANLRSPALPERLGVRASAGLTDLLDGAAAPEQVLHRHLDTGLEFLAAGSPRTNRGELLDSAALEGVLDTLRESFDYVIFDSPPLLSVADATALARRTSAVLLVARAGFTRVEALRAATDTLRSVERRPLGVVLNRVADLDRRPQGAALLEAALRSPGNGSEPGS
jgi:polysaccharide biosynthesis transport protein